MALDPLTAGVDLATTVINKIWPDKSAQEAAQLAAAEQIHGGEVLGVALELLGERIRRHAGQFRRRRLDHAEDHPVAIERLLILLIALAPIELRGNQLVDVSVDGEMTGGVDARRHRQKQARNQCRPRKPRAGLDDGDDNRCQHFLTF